MEEARITGLVVEDFDPEKVQLGDLFLVAGGGLNSGDSLYLTRMIERTGDILRLEVLSPGVERSDSSRLTGIITLAIDLTQKRFTREFIHITMDSDGKIVLRPGGPVHSHIEGLKLLLSYLASP
ncbi:MAG: hypothetical protein WC242_03305 [Candidatus Paceibacterota bacterium]|jgi:hypothetical protein